MTEEKQDLDWGLFAARILGGLGLMAVGAVAGSVLSDGDAPARWGGVGAIAGTVAAFAFMLSKYRRGDEFDRAIDRMTSVQAGLATMFLIMAQTLFAEMGFRPSDPISVFAMPGFFILYKTLIAQYLRAALAQGKDVTGLQDLRA